MFRTLLVVTVSINGKYAYLTIPINGIKVLGNPFNKLAYSDPGLKSAMTKQDRQSRLGERF
jgi:hypothetical protein